MMRAHENIDNVTNVRIDIEHLQENLEKKTTHFLCTNLRRQVAYFNLSVCFLD